MEIDSEAAVRGASAVGAIEVPYRGRLLLEQPLFNKGTAFSGSERRELGLQGLLPPHEETLDQQAARAYEGYGEKHTDLERYLYLRALQDANETLFYRLLLDHLPEMMPMIYTPTVGLACERFSHHFRSPRGLFLSYPERADMAQILDNAALPRVEVIVVTDGERILGLGDQGADGMGIPIGKLSLYTACGGIHPASTLPILLDVGTNNAERLRDPLYLGWRHERITGAEYDDFVDQFVSAVQSRFPRVLLQWEDFAQGHARPLLDRYRNQICCFNDDIQGTAAVTTGTLLAAVRASGSTLADQWVVILGAGSAGCGIAEQLEAAMVRQGLSRALARKRFFLVDRPGLLHESVPGLGARQRAFARSVDEVPGWGLDPRNPIGLLDVVRAVRPTILIGTSAQPGAFTEEIVRAMASGVERPIIFPLSNPTSRAEATPADLLAWTDGRAIVATGSPFAPVEHAGRRHEIAQCNNSYIFPGMGLGVLAASARRVSDGMFMAAADALARFAPAWSDPLGALLPPLEASRPLAREIALAVAQAAVDEDLTTIVRPSRQDLEDLVDARIWEPRYFPVRLKRSPS